jgi:hypothetical protein
MGLDLKKATSVRAALRPSIIGISISGHDIGTQLGDSGKGPFPFLTVPTTLKLGPKHIGKHQQRGCVIVGDHKVSQI